MNFKSIEALGTKRSKAEKSNRAHGHVTGPERWHGVLVLNGTTMSLVLGSGLRVRRGTTVGPLLIARYYSGFQ